HASLRAVKVIGQPPCFQRDHGKDSKLAELIDVLSRLGRIPLTHGSSGTGALWRVWSCPGRNTLADAAHVFAGPGNSWQQERRRCSCGRSETRLSRTSTSTHTRTSPARHS